MKISDVVVERRGESHGRISSKELEEDSGLIATTSWFDFELDHSKEK
jgi:hypothetical protein